jgi:hypothetical protein
VVTFTGEQCNAEAVETEVIRHGGSRSATVREAAGRHDAAGYGEPAGHEKGADGKDTDRKDTDRKNTAPRGPRWLQRIRRQLLPPPEAVLDQLNRQLAVLAGARAELEAGWIQGGWWAVGSADGGRRLVTGLEAGPVAAAGRPGRVDGVCLVGALIRAGTGSAGSAGGTGSAGGDGEVSGTGRAVDAVYEALWASRGQETATPPAELSERRPPASPLPPSAALSPVPPPAVRLARVRTIAQWNDRPGRTKAEALTVLDHAISATIMTLMATPAPKTPAPKTPAPKTPGPEGTAPEGAVPAGPR